MKLLKRLLGSTVTFYMKSGNKIKVRGIEEISITTSGGKIVKLRVDKMWFFAYLRYDRLLVESINLSQIEAIVHN